MFKEEVTQYCLMCQEWAEKYETLKAENEELKRQIKVKGNILKLTNEAKNEYLDQNNKLKQTITEIKEIAKEQQSWNDWNMRFSETESEDDIFAYNWSAIKQILQKISEVEIE